MPSNDATPFAAADLDPAVASVLVQLREASREVPRLPWSLARLSKRAELAMSTLRRTLAALEEAGLVEVSESDVDGRATAALTPAGLEFCEAIFPAAPDSADCASN